MCVCVSLSLSKFKIVCAMINFRPRNDEVSVSGGVAVPVLKSLGWPNNSPTYGWNAAGAASSYGYCTGQPRSQGETETCSPADHDDIVDSALMDVAPRKVNATKVGKRSQLFVRSYIASILAYITTEYYAMISSASLFVLGLIIANKCWLQIMFTLQTKLIW